MFGYFSLSLAHTTTALHHQKRLNRLLSLFNPNKCMRTLHGYWLAKVTSYPSKKGFFEAAI